MRLADTLNCIIHKDKKSVSGKHSLTFILVKKSLYLGHNNSCLISSLLFVGALRVHTK
jgi:hypothetical protein